MICSVSDNFPSTGCKRVFSPIASLVLFLFVPFISLYGQGSSPQREPESIILAEEIPQWRVGIAPLFGLTAHQITLDIYSGSPGCGQFSNQISGLLGVNLFGEFSLLSSPSLLLRGGVSLQNRPINFVESFAQPARYLNGVSAQVITQHRLDVEMSGVGISGGMVWEPIRNLRLGVTPSLLFLSTGNVRQYEEIVTPIGASFTETDDYQRPVNRGEEFGFNNLGFEVSAFGGLRLPLGKHVALLPEIGVSLLTTSLETSYQWRTTTYHASIGLAWEKRRKEYQLVPDPPLLADIPEQPDQPDTTGLADAQDADTIPVASGNTDSLPTDHSQLHPEIQAFGVDDEGKLYRDPVIEIRETPWSRSIPMIPHIFFEKGKATIPKRYTRFSTADEVDGFTIESLPAITPVALHHHLLNILGSRLRTRPEVSVTILGTVSREERAEDSTLALRRAKSVRDYLVDTWKIDPRRVRIDAGEPGNPSSEETEDGRSENRRAEFVFDGESLTRPVVVERLASIASPPAIRFQVNFHSNAVVDWNITVHQGGRLLLRLDSTSDASSTSATKYWPLGELRINRDLTPIYYRIEITDTSGATASVEHSFNVREHVTRDPERDGGDLQVKEFLLVGFGYNKADLRTEHHSEIYEIARTAGEGGWIEITGYTDRVGDAEHNRELAIQRARNVEKTLQDVRSRLSLPELLITNVRGVSEGNDELFDNNLPEGRIFSRMVRVTVNRQTAR